MGQWADDALDGTCCEQCGQFLGEGEGYPRLCCSCSNEVEDAKEEKEA